MSIFFMSMMSSLLSQIYFWSFWKALDLTFKLNSLFLGHCFDLFIKRLTLKCCCHFWLVFKLFVFVLISGAVVAVVAAVPYFLISFEQKWVLPSVRSLCIKTLEAIFDLLDRPVAMTTMKLWKFKAWRKSWDTVCSYHLAPCMLFSSLKLAILEGKNGGSENFQADH